LHLYLQLLFIRSLSRSLSVRPWLRDSYLSLFLFYHADACRERCGRRRVACLGLLVTRSKIHVGRGAIPWKHTASLAGVLRPGCAWLADVGRGRNGEHSLRRAWRRVGPGLSRCGSGGVVPALSSDGGGRRWLKRSGKGVDARSGRFEESDDFLAAGLSSFFLLVGRGRARPCHPRDLGRALVAARSTGR
jgi:hypothetical protein